MKYLGKEPIVFGAMPGEKRSSQIVERGGLPAPIPKKDRCPSGRHNLRLTSCYCEPTKKQR
jgi:hypothetical protein